MAEWTAVCRWDELREGRGATRDADGLRLAVFRHDGEAVALLDRCPHAGGSLGGGWIEEGHVVCPLHRWRFRLSDGRCAAVPGQNAHRFPCEVRGENVWALV